MTRHFCTSLPFSSLQALLVKAYGIFVGYLKSKINFLLLENLHILQILVLTPAFLVAVRCTDLSRLSVPWHPDWCPSFGTAIKE